LSFFVILAKQRDTAVNVGVKEGLNALHDTKDMDAGSKKKKSNKGQGIPGKVVYIMKNVSKRFDDGFVLFENINLCFFQGYLLPIAFCIFHNKDIKCVAIFFDFNRPLCFLCKGKDWDYWNERLGKVVPSQNYCRRGHRL